MHRDRLVGILLIVFCIFGWFYLIPNFIKGETQQVFPRIILIFILMPALGLALRQSKTGTQAQNTTEKQASQRAFIKICCLAIMYLGYLLLIPVLGFFVCSAAITVGTLLFLGVRKMKTLVLVPLVMLSIVHVVIERFLNFVLPTGLLL